MGITVQADGSFANTQRMLQRLTNSQVYSILDKYGPMGVAALEVATPSSTGATAHAWSYEIKQSKGSHEIVWKNSHIVKGANIAILIQYGHGTGTGGYVAGHDYINPAMRPIFEQILAEVRKVVTSR